jgi:hypothetical protein
MKREAQETNKTVVAKLKLEAPFSAKQKGVLHFSLITSMGWIARTSSA